MSYPDTYYSRTMGSGVESAAVSEDIETQVCVIGGGLAGVSTGMGLVERGINCVLVEAQQLGWGASGRNGDFVSPGFSQDALKLVRLLGEDHARRLYELTNRAVELIQQRIKGFEDSILEGQPGSLTASWFNDETGVKRYVEDMNRIFDEDLQFWPRQKVAEHYLTKRYFDGFLKPGTMRFQSLNYVLHLARLALAKGLQIFHHTPALQVTRKHDRWLVVTPSGSILTDHVVYACSGYIDSLQPQLSRATLPVATYVLLTQELGSSLEDAIRAPYAVSDNRFSSNYYRVVGNCRLLWGGRVSMFQPSQEKLAVLMLKDLLSVYPQLKGVQADVAWGGYMGYARHKMPQIGKLSAGAWYCQGFGGHGMATTTMGGELIASAIAQDDQGYQLFAPFGLDYVGKPFGPVIAQMAYWSYQLQDAFQVSRLNRKY